MRIIKVDAIDSTNTFVRKFYAGTSEFEPVCVTARLQLQGRGQRGAIWKSEAGKNLTFSILYPHQKLEISRHFLLSAQVALSILKVLKELQVPRLSVKWPNDILSANKKIGGILIENILNSDGIVASVIGIGLNVNQVDFGKFGNAGSLCSVSGKTFDLDELLKNLLQQIENDLQELPKRRKAEILEDYEDKMFRRDQVSVFRLSKTNKEVNGIIRGVSGEGKLQLELEDHGLLEFDLKEVQLLY
ncbi:MAG: biotin--[acetyl-CoA-carboxylase] ligase [Christiangramia sp.]|uniref:biotin--[acetyl-CoA-carboxylase] ligase n=1 Tax=Christiangramia sp. TaxID=1931228 RepID=UPI003241C40F